MFHKALSSTRFVIVIAVIGSLVAAIASMLFGVYRIGMILLELLGNTVNDKSAKLLSVDFIEVIDLFLIGTVFYIIALGLYELFIDDRLELPPWLIVHNLDDLKTKLINGVVVVMAVNFLGVLVSWDGKIDLIAYGAAIALVIIALSLYQFVKSKGNGH
jgi:uncharacterized membrane protein YqhA